MNVIGIICEYNPFHNGHKYQIDEIKKKYKDSLIVVCLSGFFTQRGDISILNKFEKTDIALNMGADLIIELPYVFSTSSADIFGKYAVRLLNSVGINILCFGSESNDLKKLTEIAKVQINNKEFNNLVKKQSKNGLNYPTIINNAIKDILGYSTNDANDLLAISYIKEIINNNYNIKCSPIKRTNDFHDLESNDNIISANNIRNKLLDGNNISKYVPKYVYNYLKNFKYNDKLFELLKYKIISDNDLSKYLDVNEGIEKRIKKVINKSKNINELIMNIKSKRYTYNKINRMLCHILCSFTKEENNSIKDIEYIRILGFNKRGKNYLNNIKIKYPILNSASNKYKTYEIEMKVSSIYGLIYNNSYLHDKSLKPIIKTDN